MMRNALFTGLQVNEKTAVNHYKLEKHQKHKTGNVNIEHCLLKPGFGDNYQSSPTVYLVYNRPLGISPLLLSI
jgi:hypothetical protein